MRLPFEVMIQEVRALTAVERTSVVRPAQIISTSLHDEYGYAREI